MEINKSNRVLLLYNKFLRGEPINKSEEAKNFGVTERSIQRDLDDLKIFFQQNSMENEVIYDRTKKGYVLNKKTLNFLTSNEILAVCKILLESRAFVKSEIMPIIDKLLNCCVSKEDFKFISKLIGNEKEHYIEPHHNVEFIDKLCDIGVAINEKRITKMKYEKLLSTEERVVVERIIQPVGILFSEFYFYLVGFIQNIDKEKEFKNKDDIFPTIYRIDRIKNFEVTDEHFFYHIKIDLKRGNSEKEYNLCMEENFGRLNLSIKEFLLRRCLTDCQQLKLLKRKMGCIG